MHMNETNASASVPAEPERSKVTLDEPRWHFQTHVCSLNIQTTSERGRGKDGNRKTKRQDPQLKHHSDRIWKNNRIYCRTSMRFIPRNVPQIFVGFVCVCVLPEPAVRCWMRAAGWTPSVQRCPVRLRLLLLLLLQTLLNSFRLWTQTSDVT